MSLGYYEEQYNKIMKLPATKRTYKFSKLMTKMENEFNIPALENNEWNLSHKEVIELYRRISDARKF